MEDNDYMQMAGYENSDDEAIDSSSEDEIDILLHGTPEQKRKLCQPKHQQENASSSEDEFEREMNELLNGTVKALEKRRGSVSDAGSSGACQSGHSEATNKFEDDVYCDSDEEEMVTKGDAAVKRKLTNEELFYDPDIDTNNEKWVEDQRRSYLPKASVDQKKVKPLPNSDAVLNCPACMTTLCLDCQRHAVYNNQYRAMFVRSCVVDKSEILKYPKTDKKRTGKGKKKQKFTPDPGDDEEFNPVKCEECNTVVAVYDKDEVYHFFNVLASY